MNLKKWALTVLLASLLSGCVGNLLRPSDDGAKDTRRLVKNGSLKQALERIEQNNNADEKEILYYLEKGALLALGSRYADANAAWLKADEIVRDWEEAIKTDASKQIDGSGKFSARDKTRYDGWDYEKVMLSTQLTLNYLLQGNYERARNGVKKTYAREAFIKELRDKLEQDAKDEKVSADLSQMKDYPLAELDTPEVNKLKNGFQNAFAHYLAGYFFDVTGGWSLADPAYRNALSLAPNSRLIQARLVARPRPTAQQSDVLFIIESGFAPSCQSITVPIAVPTPQGKVVTPLAFPALKAENIGFVPPTLSVAGQSLPVETLTNFDTLSRRTLKDQLPGILQRSVTRAAAKLAAQTPISTAEPVDERSWRMLPERISVARALLPKGTQTIDFQTEAGMYRTNIKIGERFTLIPIRLTGGNVYVGEASVLGELPPLDVTPPQAAKPVKARPAKATKPKPKAKAKPSLKTPAKSSGKKPRR